MTAFNFASVILLFYLTYTDIGYRQTVVLLTVRLSLVAKPEVDRLSA